MIIRTSLLYILGISIHIGAVTAQTQITVTEGSTAELSCTFKNVQNYIPHIVWDLNNKRVFERKGNELEVGDGYEGRVNVPEEKLHNGDCTLVMENVSFKDEGEYESSLHLRHPNTSVIEKTFNERVKLVVKAPEPTKEPTVTPDNDGKEHGERHESSNDSGMKHPHLVIILLSVVMVMVTA